MALALRAMHREPPPDPRGGGCRLTSDFATVLCREPARGPRAPRSSGPSSADIRAQKAWQLGAWPIAARVRTASASPLGRVRHALRRLSAR